MNVKIVNKQIEKVFLDLLIYFAKICGVTSVSFDVRGGHAINSALGGKGGQAVGTLAVTPGQVLNIYVGGGMGNHLTGSGEEGDNYDGGDASSIRTPGTALSDRIIVAGGGGGVGMNNQNWTVPGGNGGGLTGGTGGNGVNCTGGAGGSQTSGGAGGTGTTGPGTAGGLGYGGHAAAWGGGGGGYYGGGGAGANNASPQHSAAGGGGSNYLSPILTNTQNNQGVQNGNGQITITW